jgi:hypothetical protein
VTPEHVKLQAIRLRQESNNMLEAMHRLLLLETCRRAPEGNEWLERRTALVEWELRKRRRL